MQCNGNYQIVEFAINTLDAIEEPKKDNQDAEIVLTIIKLGLRNNNPDNLIRLFFGLEGKIPYPQSKDQKFERFTNVMV
jgi:hypothetical protein